MRKQIRAEISSINPLDSKERMTQSEVLAWIDSGAELFRIKKPATPIKHLVSYFVVIDGGYILLVDHINAGLWLPTGGHVEPNEYPKDTVVREAKEELNLESEFLYEKPIFLTSTNTVGKTSGHTDVSIWYVLKSDRNKNLVFDQSEFNQVQWFHKDNIPIEKTDPEMNRFLKKLFGQLKT